jgi:signal transduction histidine kinase
MDHRKVYAESPAETDRPRTGGSAPAAFAGPGQRNTHGKSVQTRQTSGPEPTGGRKRLVFRLFRRARHAGPHPAGHKAGDAQSELRRLSVQLLTLQENERQRIAADLHDGIGQSLSLIKLSMQAGFQLIEAGDSASGLALLRGVAPRLDDAIAELRRTTSDIRPPMLDDLGIIPTLSWFFRELAPVCRGKRIDTELAIAERDVPAPIKVAIFRIVQEAMNNVLKHADADVVRVCLKKSAAGVQLSIKDNGRGFDLEPAPSCRRRGFGLLTMKERATSSGGLFTVESAAGQGTCVIATWPPEDAATRGEAVEVAAAPSIKTASRRSAAAPRAMRRRSGFTLPGLLVMMVIIGLLAGYVGPKYFSQIGKSQVKTARAQIDALGKALHQLRLDTGHYPATEEGFRAADNADIAHGGDSPALPCSSLSQS